MRVGFAQSLRPFSVRFSGDAEYQAYLSQLRAFNDKSVSRLAHIKRNEKNEGPKHIALAIFYGLYDSSVDQLNTAIRGLIKDRNQAKKQQDEPRRLKAVEFLHDLRNAIVAVLGERGYDAAGHLKKP